MPRLILLIAGLMALLVTVACDMESYYATQTAEAPVIDITLNTDDNPFELKSQLTPEQANGKAELLVSYGAITETIERGKMEVRTSGQIIAWYNPKVEVMYSSVWQGKRVHVYVEYDDEDLDPRDDLHDNKDNLAYCRFDGSGTFPRFHHCRRAN